MSTVRIRRTRGFGSLRLAEIPPHRDLLYLLAWRDVKVRYKQMLLGGAWAVLQPLILMVLFTAFLGRLAHVPSDGLPYGLFAYSGLVLWVLFSQVTSGSAVSLVENTALVSKVYFPRIILPVASAVPFLLDLALSLPILVVMAWNADVGAGMRLLWAPAFALMAFVAALAAGVGLSALNVRYRDVRYALPFLMQAWLFASPVAYPASVIPERWSFLYGLNPMAGAVTGWRWATVGAPLEADMVAASVLSTIVLVLVCFSYFARTQRDFADVI